MFARTSNNRRWGIFIALALVAAVLVPAAPIVAEEAEAATASDFDPGYIISDQHFYNGNAMSAAQIQSFLDAMIGTCQNGKCLNVAVLPTADRPASYSGDSGKLACAAIAGGNLRVSELIYRTQVACSISAKVILVTLQKEQSLVTSKAPSDAALRAAMGQACPDTAGCNVAFAGLGVQIMSGARQLSVYRAAMPNSSFNFKGPGQYNIQYKPNTACGAPAVNVRNYGTLALYNYTPYQPNAAALANLYGTGDGCSSYGNRNFWRLYTDWFGSPTNDGVSPFGGVTSVTSTTASSLTMSGWAIDPDARVAGTNTWRPITVGISVNLGDQYNPRWTILGYATADKSGVTPANSYAFYGGGHDFQATIPNVPPGVREVCAIAINDPATPGQAWSFGCQTITVAYCGGGEPCPTVDRLTGADRYSVAVGISQRAYPSTAPVVYIASGAGFPDALAAAPAAARAGGPLLLTSPSELSAAVRTEIQRLNPAKIVIVGGPNSVSPAVETALKAIKPTERLAGADRFAASRDVARTFGTTPDVYIATGLNFPDALTAGTLGSHQGRPVILVPGVATTVDPALLELLRTNNVQRITIAGGPNSVSPQMEAGLKSAGYAVTRITGADRFAVSFAAQSTIAASASTVYFASGLTYPDALTGSVLAAKSGAPLYLVRPDCLTAEMIASMRAKDVSKVTLLGGPNSLSERITSFTQCG